MMQNVSAEQAAARLDEVIHRNLPNAKAQVARVFSEMPVDRKAPAELVEFAVTQDNNVQMVLDKHDTLVLHDHALSHVYGIGQVVNANFANACLDADTDWARDLLQNVLNTDWAHLVGKDGRPPAHLVRARKKPDVELGMAVLSASYNTIDTRPLLETVLEVSDKSGAVPFSATGTDLQFAIKMVIPQVQMVGGDPYVLGIEYRNSDWGGTAAGITAFFLRLACMNGMTTERIFRRVHLGQRLDRDVDWSQDTRKLDHEATISMIKDSTSQFLLPERRQSMFDSLNAAGEKELTVDRLNTILKGQVSQDMAKRVVEMVQSADPRVPHTLGKGISWLDAAQAVSALSQDIEAKALAGAPRKARSAQIGDDVLDLERFAGKIFSQALAA
ncbi:MAG: hypothetical protein WC683_02760 [bacterium]